MGLCRHDLYKGIYQSLVTVPRNVISTRSFRCSILLYLYSCSIIISTIVVDFVFSLPALRREDFAKGALSRVRKCQLYHPNAVEFDSRSKVNVRLVLSSFHVLSSCRIFQIILCCINNHRFDTVLWN